MREVQTPIGAQPQGIGRNPRLFLGLLLPTILYLDEVSHPVWSVRVLGCRIAAKEFFLAWVVLVGRLGHIVHETKQKLTIKGGKSLKRPLPVPVRFNMGHITEWMIRRVRCSKPLGVPGSDACLLGTAVASLLPPPLLLPPRHDRGLSTTSTCCPT